MIPSPKRIELRPTYCRSVFGWRFAELVLVLLLILPIATAAQSEMVRLPGGSFTMGRNDGPNDERPAHTVVLKPFWIDRRPVTNAEFAAFLETVGGIMNERGQRLFDDDDPDARLGKSQGRWQSHRGFDQHPAVEMSWYGARDYCRAQGKRLPTEAEWEYAARGTEDRRYPWGQARPDPSRARYSTGYGRTVPAGSLSRGATPDGVLELSGNVHQWTSSIALPYSYRADDGREDADRVADRVTRGGAADTGPETLRTTWRGASVSRRATAGHHNIGFRCAKDAE